MKNDMKIYGIHMENGYGTFVMKFIWPFSWEMIWKSWDYMEIPIKPHIIHINFYAILIQFNDMGLYEIELEFHGKLYELHSVFWTFPWIFYGSSWHLRGHLFGHLCEIITG